MILYAVDKNSNPTVYAVRVTEEAGMGVIETGSGRVGGKITVKATMIKKGKNIGKANETTPLEQAHNEARAKIKKAYDNGYKDANLYNDHYPHKGDLPLDVIDTWEELDLFLLRKKSTIVNFFFANDIRNNTFKDWRPMPMLADKYSVKKHSSVGNWYMQRKLNGVRCLAFLDLATGKVVLLSRGGIEYNLPHIANKLRSFLVKNPYMILDGELYLHGIPLGRLGSWAKNVDKEERINLQYHIYDINAFLKFKTRLQMLINIHSDLHSAVIRFVQTVQVGSTDNMRRFEKMVLEEDYEGVILRNPEGKYASSYRSEHLVKVKQFIDEEFEVLGVGDAYKEGDIDTFTFKLKNNTNDLTFDARPKGNRALKQEYLDNIDTIVGKEATVRFQERTEYDIPHQAHVVVIRDYE
jgi:DNA ligase-1